MPCICLAFPLVSEAICSAAAAADSFLDNRAIISNIHHGIKTSGSPGNFLALDLIRNTEISYLMGQRITSDYYTLVKDRHSVSAPTIEALGFRDYMSTRAQHLRYDLAAITT